MEQILHIDCNSYYASVECLYNPSIRNLPVSIGLSWNKIFAKFGSDYKKPDALTIITSENYQEIIWPKPVGDLLYVGS